MSDTLRGKWKRLTGKIRQQWTKLTDADADIAEASGNWDDLAGRMQEEVSSGSNKSNKRTLQ